MSTILVTGASGRVGRHVVDGLRAAGVTVRALVRTPELAGLPADVELVQGGIYDPDAVRRAAADVDAAFLLWPSFSSSGAEAIVAEFRVPSTGEVGDRSRGAQPAEVID